MTSAPTTVIHSARIVSGGDAVTDAWVRFEGDRIAGRGIGEAWRDAPAVRAGG
ncbi:N-acetylglucosamine-6-phosphate deacetylase, partial [Agromyces binzhouensis]